MVWFVVGSLAAGLVVREAGFRWHRARLPSPPPETAPAVSTLQGPPPASPARETPAPEPRVDLNRATFEDLLRLPGIGPKRARQILRYRQSHGPFRRPEDLLAVPGIGPKTLERLRPYIILGSP